MSSGVAGSGLQARSTMDSQTTQERLNAGAAVDRSLPGGLVPIRGDGRDSSGWHNDGTNSGVVFDPGPAGWTTSASIPARDTIGNPLSGLKRAVIVWVNRLGVLERPKGITVGETARHTSPNSSLQAPAATAASPVMTQRISVCSGLLCLSASISH